ncbi:hypothetical protein [Vitreimonas sp.]|uniref:hypothetical protein n=1 Tax=Vitreimonas sp. TaxID=3069702 RepID=UPI002ED99129
MSGAAAPLLSGNATDRAASACEIWLTRHAEHERLGNRWQQIETRLFRDYNWSKLTRAQRKRFPEKHEMDDLYDRMDALHEENRFLLASLPALVATSSLGICGKLAIAAIEVCPEENEKAHRLIASILRDYRALHGG